MNKENPPDSSQLIEYTEPLYTPRQIVNMIEAKGLLIHNTGKDHPSIQFWPSTEEILELIKK